MDPVPVPAEPAAPAIEWDELEVLRPEALVLPVEELAAEAVEELEYHPSYPLGNPDADIVLLSKDRVHFHVHGMVLKLTSGVFREMLGIPRSSDESSRDPIRLEEDSKTIAGLLDSVYPNAGLRHETIRKTVSSNFDELLTAADKYDMPGVLIMMRRAVFDKDTKDRDSEEGEDMCNWSAIRKFDLACKHNWIEEAKIASRLTLSCSLTSPTSLLELQKVSASTILRLQEFHRKRKELLLAALQDLPSKTSAIEWNLCKSTSCNCYNYTLPNALLRNERWKLFIFAVAKEMDLDPSGKRLEDYTTWYEIGDYSQIFNIKHDVAKRKTCSGNILDHDCFFTQFKKVLASLPSYA